MSDDQSNAEKYRREAMTLRQAAEVVRDPGLRDQLLSIAEQYEALAAGIEGGFLREKTAQKVCSKGSIGIRLAGACEDRPSK
jgi:hypothetical protein